MTQSTVRTRTFVQALEPPANLDPRDAFWPGRASVEVPRMLAAMATSAAARTPPPTAAVSGGTTALSRKAARRGAARQSGSSPQAAPAMIGLARTLPARVDA